MPKIDYFSEDQTNEDNSDDILDLMQSDHQYHQHPRQALEYHPSSSMKPKLQQQQHSDQETSSCGVPSDTNVTHAPSVSGAASGICDPKLLGQSLDLVQKRMDALDHKLSSEISEIKKMLIALHRQMENQRICESQPPLAKVSEGASGQQALPQSTSRHSNMSSVADVTESWEFRSALEAPIATLESLDEIDRQDGEKRVRKLTKNKSSDV